MRFIYSILLYLLAAPALLYLSVRGGQAGKAERHWRERLGFAAPTSTAPPLWLHAASVGEVQAALPLLRQLLERYPHHPILVTTMTATGRAQVQAALGSRVRQAYLPMDLPGAVARFLRRVRPKLVVVLETELWPNLYRALRARDIPLLVVNARLSERSAAGYRRLGALTRSTIGCITTIAAQSPADAARYAMLGATAEQLVTTGNIKFDLSVPAAVVAAGQALRAELGVQRPVWIAASTHEGEDEQMLAAHRRLLEKKPDLLLILVPRHPQRFERVAALCREQGFSVARRSRAESGAQAQVYLGDTMGELLAMYAAADVAFVGGSLVPIGGHNLLEPAALGLVPVSGPQLANFQQIAELLTAADALVRVNDAAELAAQVAALLDEAECRSAAGARARGVVDENRGALERTLALIARHL